MMKTRKDSQRLRCMRDVVFREAIEPMEAAVLPASKAARMGALSMVPRAYDAAMRGKRQRAKIWVR